MIGGRTVAVKVVKVCWSYLYEGRTVVVIVVMVS
jgi:hypothetical protein